MIFEAENIPLEMLPQPTGWRILIGPVKIQDKTDGGILLVDESMKTAEYFRNIGKVLAMGSACYEHPKFQGGIPIEDKTPVPWCKVGDIVMFSSYTGQDIPLVITHKGEKFKLKVINDDAVISVVHDTSVINFL